MLCELPENGTEVPKLLVVLVKGHAFKCVCILCIKLVSQMNTPYVL
jgi:hypothetical protein